MPTERPSCPGCGAPAATTVGPRYTGRSGMVGRRRSFEEQLFRCAEGHVYSVRSERGSRGVDVTSQLHESVEEWMRLRTGAEPGERPPGL